MPLLKEVKFLPFSLLLTLTLTGCVHSHPVKGARNIDTGSKVVLADIGSAEISAGETLDILVLRCRDRGFEGADPGYCRLHKFGEAIVMEVVDKNHSLVMPLTFLELEKPSFVEKKTQL